MIANPAYRERVSVSKKECLLVTQSANENEANSADRCSVSRKSDWKVITCNEREVDLRRKGLSIKKK
jgi:hypothetical protein